MPALAYCTEHNGLDRLTSPGGAACMKDATVALLELIVNRWKACASVQSNANSCAELESDQLRCDCGLCSEVRDAVSGRQDLTCNNAKAATTSHIRQHHACRGRKNKSHEIP